MQHKSMFVPSIVISEMICSTYSWHYDGTSFISLAQRHTANHHAGSVLLNNQGYTIKWSKRSHYWFPSSDRS